MRRNRRRRSEDAREIREENQTDCNITKRGAASLHQRLSTIVQGPTVLTLSQPLQGYANIRVQPVNLGRLEVNSVHIGGKFGRLCEYEVTSDMGINSNCHDLPSKKLIIPTTTKITVNKNSLGRKVVR